MDIEGLGERLVEQMVNDGAVENSRGPVFAHRRRTSRVEIRGAEGRRGQAGRAPLRREERRQPLQGHREEQATTLPRFLFALGIPQVGESTARALAGQFGDLAPLMKADAAKIEETPDVGPVVSQEIAKFFADPGYREVVGKLIDANITWEKIDVAQGAAACRPHVRDHRHIGRHCNATPPKRRCANSAPRCRAVFRRRPAFSWSAPMPAPSWPRRNHSACASSMKTRSNRS